MRTELIVAPRADAHQVPRFDGKHAFPTVELSGMNGPEELGMLLCLLEGVDPHKRTGTDRVNPFTRAPVPNTALSEAIGRFVDLMHPDNDIDAALLAAPLELVARLAALAPSGLPDLVTKWTEARAVFAERDQEASGSVPTVTSPAAELEFIRSMAASAYESGDDLMIWMT